MVPYLSIAAIVVSLVACGVAVWCALRPPQTRLLREARAELHELAEDVERLHALHHKRARRENIETAQAAKARQGDLLAEAKGILSGSLPAAPSPGAAAQPQSPGVSSRDELRRRLLQ